MSSIANRSRNSGPSGPSQGYKRSAPPRHQAHCTSCGAPTTLPFKPTAERPGFCAACFKKRAPVAADRAPRELRPERADHREVESHPEVFADLPIRPRSRAALARMNITTPTPIQELAIPWLSQGEDLIGQAMTGSGKTLAFGIPLVEKCSPTATGVQGLVLVPTRELAIQVASVLEAIADDRISIALLYGGHPLGGEKRTLQRGTHIIVGTPGRTLDHIRQGNLRLGMLRMLVLDEADEMLDRGFAHDVEAIIDETPKTRQTALFSATVPDWVASTSQHHLRDPKHVRAVVDETNSLKIEHVIYMIDKPLKLGALQTLLDQRGDAPIIVFGKTKHGVKKLADQLVKAGYPVGALQGNLSQNARERVMVDFRSGQTPVLVATNVAARGLDVEGIAQVINYDLPDSFQLFTHRVGRTGRMGKEGEAITFVTPDDEKKWREIERESETDFEIKRWGQNGPEAHTTVHRRREGGRQPAARTPETAARPRLPATRTQQAAERPQQRTERPRERPAPRPQRTGQREGTPVRRHPNEDRDATPAGRQRTGSRATPRPQRSERPAPHPTPRAETAPAVDSEPKAGQRRILWHR